MSVLLWETLLTRVFSAVLHYHFAFMAVSIAMFGLTAGAVLVLLKDHVLKESAPRRPRWPPSAGHSPALLVRLPA